MKIISFLSAAASLGLGVSLLALTLGAQPEACYAATASLLVLLGAVRDYSPRRAAWEPRRATVRFPTAPARREERLAA